MTIAMASASARGSVRAGSRTSAPSLATSQKPAKQKNAASSPPDNPAISSGDPARRPASGRKWPSSPPPERNPHPTITASSPSLSAATARRSPGPTRTPSTLTSASASTAATATARSPPGDSGTTNAA